MGRLNNRHNFTKVTTDVLAKRVGYICSNPKCRKHTIGPNENPEKATSIGIAAHITAASPKGPRFDPLLSEEMRSHITNGIWLCSSCATLIDKDMKKFSVRLLQSWKEEAENEIFESLLGTKQNNNIPKRPLLEADLIWNRAIRLNRGYSPKNPKRIEDGKEIMVIDFTKGPAIIFWEIKWNFKFAIYNNSSVPAYNVKIEEISNTKFDSLTKLNNINNLPPFENLDLEATTSFFIEGIYSDADKLMLQKIPKILDGLTLKISYQDEEKNNYSTIIVIYDNQITNTDNKLQATVDKRK